MNLRLYATVALALFGLGFLYRVAGWFTRNVGPAALSYSAPRRVAGAARGIAGVLVSRKILALAWAFLADVLFHRRLFAESRFRWAAHLGMYFGFVALIAFHALGSVVTARLAGPDFARADPWLFLRDLSGSVVLLGALGAVLRRIVAPRPRVGTGPADVLALFAVFLILVSGVALAGAKIVSPESFQAMADDYAGLAPGDPDFDALLGYWSVHYGAVAPGPVDAETLEQGQAAHEASCRDCHSAPGASEFLALAASLPLASRAEALDRLGAPNVLLWVHVLAALAALALIPWTKFFHIIASSLSVLANAVMDPETSRPENIATRQALELSACTRCMACTAHCSMAPAAAWYENPDILPSEKLAHLRSLGRGVSGEKQAGLLEGVSVCTSCDRCTVNCPAGINLAELWRSALARLTDEAPPEPTQAGPLGFAPMLLANPREAAFLSRHAARLQKALCPPVETGEPLEATLGDREARDRLSAAALSGTFSRCYNCEQCTNACPVVEEARDVAEDLGLTPSQIMRTVGLGLPGPARKAPMLWKCLTCYRCQEVCPSDVAVADVLMELRNQAARETGKSAPQPGAPETRGARP